MTGKQKRYSAEFKAKVALGALKGSWMRVRRLMARLAEALEEPIDLLPEAGKWIIATCKHDAAEGASAHSSGLLIGGKRLLIAAHALTADCILVTDNAREFIRVAGLKVENWLR